MILKWDKFLEKNLDRKDLDLSRGNVLIRKLLNKEPIKTSNGQLVVIDKMKLDDEWVDTKTGVDNLMDDNLFNFDKAIEYLTKGRYYDDVFKDKSGKLYRLSNFQKTEEFGSKGAGRKTQQFETIQTIFLAIKQTNPDEILDHSNFEKFFNEYITKSDYDLVKTPKNIKIDKELLIDYLSDKDWIDTFCEIPNKLWNNKLVDRNKIYVIYQISHNQGTIKLIKDKFSEISKLENFKEINFAKWCPADVFLVDSQYENRISELLKGFKTINDLNIFMDRLFDRKILIPISLKKIKIEKNKRNFNIIINRERGKELPNFKLKDFLVSPINKGTGSKISVKSIWKYKDKKLDAKIDRYMRFDSPSTSSKSNVDGEVEGSTSRHGKISLTMIKYFLDSSKMNLPYIPSSKELQKLNLEELKKMESDLISQINEPPKINRARDNNSEGKLISKIQSLLIVLSVKMIWEKDSNLCNDILTKIFRYALSIQTHKFDTPRYLRVI